MKKLLPIAIGIVFILSGCSKETPVAEEEADEEAIRTLIEENEEGWFNAFLPLGDTLIEDSIGGGYTLVTEGDTFNFVRAWGREPLDRTIDIEVYIHNDTADVEINATLNGILHVAGPDTMIEKEFTDHGHRSLRFIRTGRKDDRHRGWSLDAISLYSIESEGMTVSIDSVRIVGGEYDTTVTDPSLLWQREEVFLFPPQTPVTIYLYVNEPTSILGFLHYNTRNHHHRRSPRFLYDAETGALVGTWTTPSFPGVYHAAIDILHWASLFVMSYPYDSNAWVFTYRVGG